MTRSHHRGRQESHDGEKPKRFVPIPALVRGDHWNRIAHLLSGQLGQHGGVGHDICRFLDPIGLLAKTGIAWVDLPTCYWLANSLWQRDNRWCHRGV